MKRHAWLVLGVSAILSGCAGGAEPADGPSTYQPASVTVENNNWLDVTVYAQRGDFRARLGMVTSMSERRFAVPRSVLSDGGTVQFVADPIGMQTTYLSDAVNVWPGQTIELKIENELVFSRVSIAYD